MRMVAKLLLNLDINNICYMIEIWKVVLLDGTFVDYLAIYFSVNRLVMPLTYKGGVPIRHINN